MLTDTLARAREALGETHPTTVDVYYNLACFATIQGQKTRALRFLRSAVENGWSSIWITSDPDFEALHGDPDFEALVEMVEARREPLEARARAP